MIQEWFFFHCLSRELVFHMSYHWLYCSFCSSVYLCMLTAQCKLHICIVVSHFFLFGGLLFRTLFLIVLINGAYIQYKQFLLLFLNTTKECFFLSLFLFIKCAMYFPILMLCHKKCNWMSSDLYTVCFSFSLILSRTWMYIKLLFI